MARGDPGGLAVGSGGIMARKSTGLDSESTAPLRELTFVRPSDLPGRAGARQGLGVLRLELGVQWLRALRSPGEDWSTHRVGWGDPHLQAEASRACPWVAMASCERIAGSRSLGVWKARGFEEAELEPKRQQRKTAEKRRPTQEARSPRSVKAFKNKT